ncbi:MAG: hypothetical protein RIS64_1149 [Bacteroidota bacterium]
MLKSGVQKDPLERDAFVFLIFLQKKSKKQTHLSPPRPLVARKSSNF